MRSPNTINPIGNLSLKSWVAIVLLTSFVCCTTNQQKSPAKFDTDSLEWNVGVLTKSQPEYVYNIPLRNVGGETLHILKLESGCPCLTLDCPSQEIPPGRAIALTATLHTDQMAAQDPFVREITLQTDADSAEIIFSLTGALYR